MLPESSRPDFPTSRWTIILQAGAGAREALEELAGRYWRPIYAFVRRSGRPRHEAEDLTQDFFAFLLEGHVIARADRARGRFRGFIRTCLRHYLANEYDRRKAAIRGGDRKLLSLDVEGAERILDVAAQATPDALFDRLWALEIIDRAVRRLKEALPDQAREAFGLACRVPPVPYKEIGERVGMREEAVAMSVHRSRETLREILTDEIRSTLADEADYHEELAYVMEAATAGGAPTTLF